MHKSQIKYIVFVVAIVGNLFAWSGVNHTMITKEAMETLPENYQEILGSAADSLINHYCLNPDLHRSAVRSKHVAKQAFYEKYINLPLLQSQKKYHKNDDDDSEICFYITTKLIHHAIINLQQGNSLEAAKYLGTLSHFLEDNACPVHILPDQTIQELLPSEVYPKRMDKHRAVDGVSFILDIDGYKPKLLGDNIVELSEAIYFRFKENRINSRGQTVPLLQAIYDKKKKKINKYANAAARPAAELLADTYYTIFYIMNQ